MYNWIQNRARAAILPAATRNAQGQLSAPRTLICAVIPELISPQARSAPFTGSITGYRSASILDKIYSIPKGGPQGKIPSTRQSAAIDAGPELHYSGPRTSSSINFPRPAGLMRGRPFEDEARPTPVPSSDRCWPRCVDNFLQRAQQIIDLRLPNALVFAVNSQCQRPQPISGTRAAFIMSSMKESNDRWPVVSLFEGGCRIARKGRSASCTVRNHGWVFMEWVRCFVDTGTVGCALLCCT